MFQFRNYQDLNASPIFLPEVGTFFNQDTAKAQQLIAKLLRCGVTCLKGEILHSADLALNVAQPTAYFDTRSGQFKTENYRQLIERKVMSFAQYEQVFAQPISQGTPLVFSVYDIEGADFACAIGAKALKVASSNLVHFPLIRYLAQKGVPTILDTGKAHFYEIARAVEWFKQAGGKDLLLEHSPAGPPAPAKDQYLSMLPILQRTFDCPVGLSDHYHGTEMLLASVALGASILEKGIMFADMDGEQDTSHAMLVEEVPKLITQMGEIYEATHLTMRPAPSATHAARMGLVAQHDLTVGAPINLQTVTFAWPALGVAVENWPSVEGMALLEPVAAGQPIYRHQIA